MTKWLTELRENVTGPIITTLIGNKKDLRHLRAVTTDEAQAFAQAENMNFLEVSALDSENIEIAFMKIIEDTYHFMIDKNDGAKIERPIKMNMMVNSNKANHEPEKKTLCCQLN